MTSRRIEALKPPERSPAPSARGRRHTPAAPAAAAPTSAAGTAAPPSPAADLLQRAERLGHRVVTAGPARYRPVARGGPRVAARVARSTVQREKVTLSVDSQQHEDAVDVEPENEEHEVGFRMNAHLEPENASQYADVSDRFDLRQYVKDSHWMAFANGDYDEDTNVEEDYWELDEFGYEDAGGEWTSDNDRTSFFDQPGFLGDRAIPATHVLGNYKVKFYWTVAAVPGEGEEQEDAEESGEIELEADPDDDGNVTYNTEDLNEDFDL